MSKWGIAITLFLMMFTLFLTFMSIVFLIRAKDYCGKKDYKSQAGFAFKKIGPPLVDFLIFTNNYGLNIAYLIIYQAAL